MQRYVCLHGHFYQPPRENPWLDAIEFQDSAYPFHDWNERVTAECYGPNAVARVLSPDGKILRLNNNYARISFDFGPTLLSWMQRRAADVYAAVRRADAESRERFHGHGAALALPFGHPILPLASAADKLTHVVWGVRDFQHRFGRDPEGMWLPECAVDLASLEVLAAHGVRFTILAPHQAHRARPRDGAWQDVTGGRIDVRRAYVQKLPSGRSIAVFFYHDAISRGVLFERLLESGEELANRLLGAFDARDEPQLVHTANDGEAFGHHHSHGDMALASALGRIEASDARLTCYAEFLDLHPPQWEVQIVENTSWSCPHGVERWRADCGCPSRDRRHHQKWRAPMREAIVALREAIRPAFEAHAGDLLDDPAASRNDYVRVLLEGTPEAQDRFLDAHARRRLDGPARVKALELMEMQRHLLLASVSCGWFFDEISGLESTQVLASAARAVQIAERLFAQPFEKAFLEALEQAPSNLPEYGNGRVVYDKLVRPGRVERQNVAAHYAISSLFESYPQSTALFSYRVERHDERPFEAGRLKMNVGHATLTSSQTQESWEFAYAAMHLGDHNVTAGVGAYPGAETYAARAEAFAEAFARADVPTLMRLMDRHFGDSIHSLSSLFKDEQRRVLKRLLKVGLAGTMDLYSRVHEQAQPLMRFLKHLAVPLPLPLRAATEVLCNTDLRWAMEDDDPNFDQIRDLLRQAREWGVVLDDKTLRYRFSRLLARAAERWRDQPTLVEPMLVLLAGLDLARELPFDADLYLPQNVYFELIDAALPEMAKQAGDEGLARTWVERFVELGEKLGVDVADVKKKLVSPARRPKVAELVGELSLNRRVPLATYRLQMNDGFTFDQAAEIVDYLDALGVSDAYLSPILTARPGSQHGYDVCDPSRLNPELGGEEGFSRLSERLAKHGMGVLLDVVPNHVGIGHVSNRWWMDVLENGPGSAYAHYFDVDWSPVNPDLRGKVLLPNLGDQFGLALEQGVFRLAYEKGSFHLLYYDKEVPLAPRTYLDVLSSKLDYLCKRLGEQHESVLEYRSILTALEHLPGRDLPPERRAERYREVAIVKRRLAALVDGSADVRAAVEGAVDLYNGNAGNPASFDRLDALIAAQAYRPAFWQVAMEEINYRRFFDVNDLAAIRTELPDVFDATHEVPLRLLAEGKVHGLRIDHPDGLHSPTKYFRRLQECFVEARLRPRLEGFSAERGAKLVREALDGVAKRGAPWPLYVLAEKILGEGEPLPGDWALDGTTGYDFLVLLNGLFVASENGAALDRVYAGFVGEVPRFDELVRQCKRLIMEEAMASEINSLSHQLDRLAERNRRYRDFTLNNVQQAVTALIACLPVYRTYTTAEGEVSARDRAFIEQATEEAKHLAPRTAERVFDFLRDTILLRNREQFPEEDRPRLLEWVLRFQQVTGPVMAKGIEDTAFYVYNRLVSLNEVGGHPHKLGTSVEEFHEQNRLRAEHWPHGMLSSSTHDTKRSEDVRARLNVLSEMPDEWQRVVNDWKQMHAPLVRRVNGQPAPSANDQYLFYQSLVGVWEEGGDAAELTRRLEEYVGKAAKEAKQATSWLNPDAEYEEALCDFVRGAMADEGNFRGSLEGFARKAAHFGRFNSLAQVLFKLTAPGVPDTYQGNELWDLSLVDPDNRRPVDYAKRRADLEGLRRLTKERGLLATSRELLSKADDGRVKLFVTERTLALRKRLRAVFQGGGYTAVRLTGEQASCGCAYLREAEGVRVLVAGCVRGVRLTGGRTEVPAGVAWGDTFLILPDASEGEEWVNELTGERVRVVIRDGEAGVWAREAMATLPVGVLVKQEPEA